MSTHPESAALSAAFSQIPRTKTGTRYPKALRLRALTYAHARRAEGASLSKIAAEIALSVHTLRHWLSAPASRTPPTPAVASFQSVHVLPTRPDAVPTLRIHGPCGLLIEGLDLDSLADLLRRLSC